MRGVFFPSVFVVAVVSIAAYGCGGSDAGSVTLAWQPSQGNDILVKVAEPGNAPVYQTVIYVSNDTDETLHDARLRFRPDFARNAPIGFQVGTVAPISSRYEGNDQVWPVGDLPPGAHVSVPLGLWFQLQYQTTSSHPIELTLDLLSQDLDAAVESNALKVRLAP